MESEQRSHSDQCKVLYSTVIDSQVSVKHFVPPNAAYTMNRSEKYANSGWLVPKGQEQVFPGSLNRFTVTFQKAGIYHYICQLHPWMTGPVLMKYINSYVLFLFFPFEIASLPFNKSNLI